MKSVRGIPRLLAGAVLGALVMALFVASTAPAYAAGDDFWATGFSRVGADGMVQALLPTDGGLVAAGNFEFMGETRAPRIAHWDGAAWNALGEGLDGAVICLVEWEGDLIAAGDFSTAGGALAAGIARWDGASWHALGVGADGPVIAMAVYAGALVAAGDFSSVAGPDASRIAQWDGASWQPLGEGLEDLFTDLPQTLIVFDGGLVAGGTDALAVWDGVAWSAPYGLPGVAGTDPWYPDPPLHIKDLLVHKGELYAAGDFWGNDDDGWYSSIARWDGAVWRGLGQGLFGSPSPIEGPHYARTACSDDDDLVVGGYFMNADGVENVCGIARWDGEFWQSVGDGACAAFAMGGGEVLAVARWNDSLFMGGWFLRLGEGMDPVTGGSDVHHIARWSGEEWGAVGDLGLGLDGPILAMLTYGDQLVVAGAFDQTGATSSRGVAAWTGEDWTDLGGGLSGSAYGQYGKALTVYEGDLILGGQFSEVGDVTAQNVARWDGESWQALGYGMIEPVQCLAVYNGQLYANGYRWDGEVWTNVLQIDAPVLALQVWNGLLIAGGDFGTAQGQSVGKILSWDGATIGTLDGGVHGGSAEVRALTIYQEELLVGGSFSNAGEVEAPYLASWNGDAWSVVAPPLDGLNSWYGVYALVTRDQHLFVGGRIDQAGELPVNHIARWDGNDWFSMGSGVTGTSDATWPWHRDNVHALHLVGDLLAVGGNFSHAGDRPSHCFGLWRGLETVSAPDLPDHTATLLLEQNHPNPFNPRTTIRFALPAAGPVRLTIHDVSGRRVRTLIEADIAQGQHTITWNGRDDRGRVVAAGSYLYHLQSSAGTLSKKMVLLK